MNTTNAFGTPLSNFKQSLETFKSETQAFTQHSNVPNGESAIVDEAVELGRVVEDLQSKIAIVEQWVATDSYRRPSEYLLSLNELEKSRFAQFTVVDNDKIATSAVTTPVAVHLHRNFADELEVLQKYRTLPVHWVLEDVYVAFKALCRNCKKQAAAIFETLEDEFQSIQRNSEIGYCEETGFMHHI